MDTDKKLKECKGKWEKNRRKRLNDAFDKLNKVLPSYDPSVNLAKVDIIEQATAAIQELSDKLKKALNADDKENAKGDVLFKFESRIKKLLLRNEFLSNLLKDAGIKVPNGYGTVKKKIPKYSKQITAEQGKVLEKMALEKETPISVLPKKAKDKKARKEKSKPKLVQIRSPINKRKRIRKTGLVPNPKCLIIFSQASSVNNSLYFLAKNDKTKSDTAIHLSSVLRAPVITSNIHPSLLPSNPSLSHLGPGNLIFPNGSIIPINQNPTLIANPIQDPGNTTVIVVSKSHQIVDNNEKTFNHSLISINVNKPIVTPVPIITLPQVFGRCENTFLKSSINFIQSQWPKIKPRLCSTNTTQVNKVPIPALTSKYNNYVYITNKPPITTEKAPVKCKNVKSKDDNNILNQIKRKSDEKPVSKAKKVKTDITATKGDKENKKTNTNLGSPNKNSNINDQKNTVKSTTEIESANTDLETNHASIAENNVPTKPQDNVILSSNKKTEPIIKPKSPKSKDENKGQQTVEKEIEKTADEPKYLNTDKDHNKTNSGDNMSIVKTAQQLELNVSHSDLSNDIFSSLHVPPGCQNSESTSPTAAFLMAFPLVSSGIKVTEVIDGDNNSGSQRETPNLLQIGTMDETKPTQTQTESHSESLTPSLLNLENFSFFPHKESYSQFGLTPGFSSSVFPNVTCGSYASKIGLFDDLFYSQAVSSLASTSKSIEISQENSIYSYKDTAGIMPSIKSETSSFLPSLSTTMVSQQNSVLDKNVKASHNILSSDKSRFAETKLPLSHVNTKQNKHPISQVGTSTSVSSSLDISTDNTSSAVVKSYISVSESISIDNSQNIVKNNNFSETSKPNTLMYSHDIGGTSNMLNKVPDLTNKGISFPSSIYGNAVSSTSDTNKVNKEKIIGYSTADISLNSSYNLGSNLISTSDLKSTKDTSQSNFVHGTRTNIVTSVSNTLVPNSDLTNSSSGPNQIIPSDLPLQNVAHHGQKSYLFQEKCDSKIQANVTLQSNMFASNNFQNNRYFIGNAEKNTQKIDLKSKDHPLEHTNPKSNHLNKNISGSKVTSNFNVQKSNITEGPIFSQNIFENYRYLENNVKQDFMQNLNDNHDELVAPNLQKHYSVEKATYKDNSKSTYDLKTLPNAHATATTATPKTQNFLAAEIHLNPNIFEPNIAKYSQGNNSLTINNPIHTDNNFNFNYYPLQMPITTTSAVKSKPDALSNTNQKATLSDFNQFNYYPQYNTSDNIKAKNYLITNSGLENLNLYSMETKQTSDLCSNTGANYPKPKNGSALSQPIPKFNPNIYSFDTKNKKETSLNPQATSNNPKNKSNFLNNINQNIASENFNFNPYSIEINRKTSEPRQNLQTMPVNNVKNESRVYQKQNIELENCTYNQYDLNTKRKDNAPNLFNQNESSIVKSKNDSIVNANHNLDMHNFNFDPYSSHGTRKKAEAYPTSNLKYKSNPSGLTHQTPSFYPQIDQSNNLKTKSGSGGNPNQDFNFNPSFNVELKKQKTPASESNQKNLFLNKPNEYPNYSNKKISCTYTPDVSNFNPCYTNAGSYYNNYNSENNYGNSYVKNSSNQGNNSYYLDYDACSENRKQISSNNYGLDPYNREKFASIITTKAKSSTQQSKPVNWMTTPSNNASSKDFLLPPFSKDTNNLYSNSLTTSVAGNILTYTDKKNVGLSSAKGHGQTEERQFSWSPSKVPSFLDPAHSFVSATLPTLVGDLALNTQPHVEVKTSKDKTHNDSEGMRKVGSTFDSQNNQPNFLSVSQLVENKETTPSKVASRRNSGSRTKNTSPQKAKRGAKADQNKFDKNTLAKDRVNEKSMKNCNKNVTSSYSAEALIGQPVQSEPKKSFSAVSGFLPDNLVTYFPSIESQDNNYLQQQTIYSGNTSFPHSFANSFQNTICTTGSIISNPPTTYLPTLNNFNMTQEFCSDGLNIYPNTKDKTCGKGAGKDNEKPGKSSNTTCKKSNKKRSTNEGLFPSFDIPFLSIPGAINSPILPDDFHHSFLPPTTPYTCKNSLYPKQSGDLGALLPTLAPVPVTKTGVAHPDVSPSVNSAGTSLTNFNLSTIFPEINKGPPSSQVFPDKFKNPRSHSLPASLSGNFGKPTFTFSSYNS